MALVNNAELIIDDVSGFVRDREYRRCYALDKFHIPCRKATPAERLEPFGYYRRGLMKLLSRKKPFQERYYLEQVKLDFDERLLNFKVKKNIYIEGCWQSENYFKDIEDVIREDLRIITPEDTYNRYLAQAISNYNSVALHVRWFDNPDTQAVHNLPSEYYQKAIGLIESKVNEPHYFVFSDKPEAVSRILAIPKHHITFISNNRGDDNAYADLWLMSQCKYFITANSTFSWWGAWLGNHKEKIVITPLFHHNGVVTAWHFKGLIPDSWHKIDFENK